MLFWCCFHHLISRWCKQSVAFDCEPVQEKHRFAETFMTSSISARHMAAHMSASSQVACRAGREARLPCRCFLEVAFAAMFSLSTWFCAAATHRLLRFLAGILLSPTMGAKHFVFVARLECATLLGLLMYRNLVSWMRLTPEHLSLSAEGLAFASLCLHVDTFTL